MKTVYTIVLALVLAAVLLFPPAKICLASEEKAEEGIWPEGQTESEQTASPNAVRPHRMHEKLRDMPNCPSLEADKPFMKHCKPAGPQDEMGKSGRLAILRERVGEYTQWLEKNYPEKAQKIAELKGTDPELYRRQIMLTFKKYGRIFEAEQDNPELAKVLKESLELKTKQDKLLNEIKETTDETKKGEITRQLKDVLSNRYELILKQKQIAYEQMTKQIEKLKNEVEKGRQQVEKWKDAKQKDEIVKTKLEELVKINGTETFRWTD